MLNSSVIVFRVSSNLRGAFIYKLRTNFIKNQAFYKVAKYSFASDIDYASLQCPAFFLLQIYFETIYTFKHRSN